MAQPPRGKPRSEFDWARELYDNTISQDAMDEAELAVIGSHPSTAQSLIPVWGSTREALADLYDHDYPGAAFNTGLAFTDLGGGWAAKSMVKATLKDASKEGSKIGRSGRAVDPNLWRHSRGRMVQNGYLEKGQDGHHWLIPQNGWAKKIPTAVKNQPWNIKPMPNSEVGKAMHGRITNAYTMPGRPKVEQMKRYNALQRYLVGTPTWAKAVQAGIIGHPAGAAKAEWDRSR